MISVLLLESVLDRVCEQLVLESRSEIDKAYEVWLGSGDRGDFDVFYSGMLRYLPLFRRKVLDKFGEFVNNVVDVDGIFQDIGAYFLRSKLRVPSAVNAFMKYGIYKIGAEVQKVKRAGVAVGEPDLDDDAPRFDVAYHDPGSIIGLLLKSPARLFDLIDKITLERDPTSAELKAGAFRGASDRYSGGKVRYSGGEINPDFLTPKEARVLKMWLGGVAERARSNPYSRESVGILSGNSLSEIGREYGVSKSAMSYVLDAAKEKLESNLMYGGFDSVSLSDS